MLSQIQEILDSDYAISSKRADSSFWKNFKLLTIPWLVCGLIAILPFLLLFFLDIVKLTDSPARIGNFFDICATVFLNRMVIILSDNNFLSLVIALASSYITETINKRTENLYLKFLFYLNLFLCFLFSLAIIYKFGSPSILYYFNIAGLCIIATINLAGFVFVARSNQNG